MPTAQAKLPETKTNRIVPGKKVAGVKLGMKMKRAAKVWKMEEGHGCYQEFGYEGLRCMFEVSPSGANFHTGNISYFGQKKVKRILLNAPHQGMPDFHFNSKMNRYKTKKGVRIGATKQKLDNEFGNKLKRTGSNAGYTTFTVAGPKKAKSIFTLYGGRITSIDLTAG
ncbi:MAG TPA: hypothetical protein VD790_06840 [Thermoleophilaceae bacterium]|nr:hypothetical protein [Thermoleophilaceae bacterium]